MKRLVILLSLMTTLMIAKAQKESDGFTWDLNYTFNNANVFNIEFYTQKNKLIRTQDYKIFNQSDGQNFCIVSFIEKGKDCSEVLFDKKNEAVIIGYKSEGKYLIFMVTSYDKSLDTVSQKLELTPTDEIRQILGYDCKKFIFSYNSISGEAWITNDVNLSNDLGILMISKIESFHSNITINGFVMEITTIDQKGKKQIMKTKFLSNNENYTVNCKGIQFSTPIDTNNKFAY